jgi:uncharacterized OsmC-like protein
VTRVRRRVRCHRARNSPVELELLLGGDLSEEQRQRLAEIASRCPIHRTLTEGVTITHC